LAVQARVCETGEVITVSLETWVSIGSLLIATLTLAAFTRSTVASAEARLGQRIDGVEANLGKRIDSLDAKIDGVEANLGKRIDSVEANLSMRIDKLDDRVYALAVGMRPLLDAAENKTAPVSRRPA
jgi:hypothetical protein